MIYVGDTTAVILFILILIYWKKKDLYTKDCSFPGCLSALSFCVVITYLTLYIIGRLKSISSLNNIFDVSKDSSFIWVIIIFVVSANFGYVRDLIRASVDERIGLMIRPDTVDLLAEKILSNQNLKGAIVKALAEYTPITISGKKDEQNVRLDT